MDRDPTTWSASDAGVATADNTTVEPKEGRLVLFTSAEENLHMVRPVTRGTRYAFTLGWTCDETKAIGDFLSRAMDAQQRADARIREAQERRARDRAEKVAEPVVVEVSHDTVELP